MPPKITTTSLRSRIFALPPALRSAHARTFSASTPCRSASEGALFESVFSHDLLANQVILDTLHQSGLPWAAAIPATAIFVRMILLHWPARNQQKLNNISRRLTPLLRARADLHATVEQRQAEDGRRENSKRGSRERFRAYLFRNAIKKPIRSIVFDIRSRRQLRQIMGLPRLQWYGLLNFGILIYFSEVLRVKCGMAAGLVSSGLSPLYRVWAWLRYGGSPHASDVTSTTTAAASPSQTFNISTDNMDDTPFLLGTDSISPSGLSVPTPSLSDPSMHLEGLPWITDLTLTDPTFILPMMMSASMILPVVLEARANAQQQSHSMPLSAAMEDKGKWVNLTFFQRIRVSVGFLMFFISMNWPSGVVLYVATSMAAGAFHRGLLRKAMPPPPLINPCKRPIRGKIKSRWSEY